jgi:hypothetical protein
LGYFLCGKLLMQLFFSPLIFSSLSLDILSTLPRVLSLLLFLSVTLQCSSVIHLFCHLQME